MSTSPFDSARRTASWSAVRPKFQIARNVCCALRRLNFGVAARDPIAPIRAEREFFRAGRLTVDEDLEFAFIG